MGEDEDVEDVEEDAEDADNQGQVQVDCVVEILLNVVGRFHIIGFIGLTDVI